jgi:hypothetical protein
MAEWLYRLARTTKVLGTNLGTTRHTGQSRIGLNPSMDADIYTANVNQ